jgi:hypothetical protein
MDIGICPSGILYRPMIAARRPLCALSETGGGAGKSSAFEFSIVLMQAIDARRTCGIGIHAFCVSCQATGEISGQMLGAAFLHVGLAADKFLF